MNNFIGNVFKTALSNRNFISDFQRAYENSNYENFVSNLAEVFYKHKLIKKSLYVLSGFIRPDFILDSFKNFAIILVLITTSIIVLYTNFIGKKTGTLVKFIFYILPISFFIFTYMIIKANIRGDEIELASSARREARMIQETVAKQDHSFCENVTVPVLKKVEQFLYSDVFTKISSILAQLTLTQPETIAAMMVYLTSRSGLYAGTVLSIYKIGEVVFTKYTPDFVLSKAYHYVSFFITLVTQLTLMHRQRQQNVTNSLTIRSLIHRLSISFGFFIVGKFLYTKNPDITLLTGENNFVSQIDSEVGKIINQHTDKIIDTYVDKTINKNVDDKLTQKQKEQIIQANFENQKRNLMMILQFARFIFIIYKICDIFANFTEYIFNNKLNKNINGLATNLYYSQVLALLIYGTIRILFGTLISITNRTGYIEKKIIEISRIYPQDELELIVRRNDGYSKIDELVSLLDNSSVFINKSASNYVCLASFIINVIVPAYKYSFKDFLEFKSLKTKTNYFRDFTDIFNSNIKDQNIDNTFIQSLALSKRSLLLALFFFSGADPLSLAHLQAVIFTLVGKVIKMIPKIK